MLVITWRCLIKFETNRRFLSSTVQALIKAYLTRVDNWTDDRYQQKVAEKLTREAVSLLFYEFDMNNELNKRLVKMCIGKGIFADDSQNSVVLTLMTFGKELEEFQAKNSEQTEASTQNLEVKDDVRLDVQSERYIVI